MAQGKLRIFKMCDRIFRDGGDINDVATLMRLMGKAFPKRWEYKFNESYEIRRERQAKIEEFKREAFKRCRPVKVTISVR